MVIDTNSVRFAFALSLAATVLTSPGCLVLSVHPAYVGSPDAIDDRLIGNWRDAESGSTATIAAGEWKAYRITFKDRTVSLQLTAFETHIGTARFLDLTPEGGLEQTLLLLPLHAICRITLDEDRLTVTPIDYDRFTSAASAKTVGRIAFTIDERKNVVLSGSASAVRGWIQEHLALPGFLGPPVVFTRVPPG